MDERKPNQIFMPTLDQLFSDFPFPYSPIPNPAAQITGIAIDNRKVQPGDLFVAMQGSAADGHDFIADAVQRGAAAVVGEPDEAVDGRGEEDVLEGDGSPVEDAGEQIERVGGQQQGQKESGLPAAEPFED